ncbi:MAG: hypothetical protein WC789_10565 [Lentisphaeria bacterium]
MTILENKTVERARECSWTFANYVLDRDPCDMHREWHAALDRHPYWILFGAVELAKSQQLSICRPLWELGRDPTLATALIGNTATQAELRGRQYRELLAYSDRMHRVFPRLYPDPRGHDSDSIIDVMDRPRGASDPSIRCVGVNGPLRQSRLNLITADDAADFGNTLTEHMRDFVHGWLLNEVVGRLLPGGRFRVYGNAVHPDDFMHRFEREGVAAALEGGDEEGLIGWVSARYPIDYKEDVLDPETGRVLHEKGEPRFPGMWTRQRILQRRRILGTVEAARQLDCVARDDSTSMVKSAWMGAALEKGRPRDECGAVLDAMDPRNRDRTGIVLALNHRELPNGTVMLTGTDLGFSKAKTANETAFCDVQVEPSGFRRLLCVEGGKWDPPETARTAQKHLERYGSEVWVESTGQQSMLHKMMPELGYARIRAHCTGSTEPNLKSEMRLFAWELEQGMWSFPSDVTGTKPATAQVERLCKDILNYREGDHMPDRLSALLIARSHAPLRPYKEAVREPRVRLRGGRVWTDGVSRLDFTNGRRQGDGDSVLGWRFWRERTRSG